MAYFIITTEDSTWGWDSEMGCSVETLSTKIVGLCLSEAEAKAYCNAREGFEYKEVQVLEGD